MPLDGARGIAQAQTRVAGEQARTTRAVRLADGAREPREQGVEALGQVVEPAPWMHQAPRQGAHQAPLVADPAARVPLQTAHRGGHLPAPFARQRADQLGRRRRRRRAPVGGEVGDGDVDFVTDAGDHRHATAAHGARHRLVVEGPQVFERAATARQDQHVALAALAGHVQHAGDGRCRLRALHRHRVDEHRDGGKATCEHAEDVSERRPRGRGHDADAPRQPRNVALARLVEQALLGEALLERLEGAAQRAGARLFEKLHDQLEIAALRVKADAPVGEHLHAVLGGEVDAPVVHAEHGAAHLAAVVLEGEINVAGARPREIGDLALDPDTGKAVLEQRARLQVELGDGVDVALQAFLGGRAAIGHGAL